MSSSTQTIKLALIGATGRLGEKIVQVASSHPFFEVSLCFDSKHPAYHHSEIDLFLDVSTPHVLSHNLQIAISAKKPIVVGTTGHENMTLLKEAAKDIPVFYAANFSIGMALMQRASLLFTKDLPNITSFQIKETHHAMKKDTPSGSALTLARSISKKLPSISLQIDSKREGDVIGIHELNIKTEHEQLTLIHEVKNRTVFAEGALAAAQFLMKKEPGLYGMEDLLS
ncbi:MAG TPA: dihydrodipicolinate reductase C-terminal domain-containing protein [Chlamydiales bacterium]|nr:dihydrodipicolinate reductase C-terminal domain-containing protein [Chlamydiales bacterium]